MENVIKHRNIKLVTTELILLKILKQDKILLVKHKVSITYLPFYQKPLHY